MLTFPVFAIGWTASTYNVQPLHKRLNEFLNTRPTIQNELAPKKIALQGNISFKNVDFTYPHTGIEAENFSLEIRKGNKIAIVGRTGTGKSTIAQLLLRMYDVTKGNIEFDGLISCN
jgi:ATP-binding cassette subfamily B protein